VSDASSEVALTGKKRVRQENLLKKEVQSDEDEDKDEKKVDDDGEDDKVVDSEDELRAFKDADPASKEWKNRQRTLIVCSRGIAGRMRHLVQDILNIIPNTKKEAKVDRK
jgi:ribosome biogenesis protein BRX1